MARKTKNRSISISHDQWMELQAIQEIERFNPTFAGMISTAIDDLVFRYRHRRDFQVALWKLKTKRKGKIIILNTEK